MFAVSFDELHNEVDWTGYDCVDQRPVAGAGAGAKTEDERAHTEDGRWGESVDCKIVRL